MYEWLKAGHVLSIIAWMAAMLYLPRLFVYHAGVEAGSESSETFKVMERRLYKAIMTPAMLSSWVFGLAMILYAGLLTTGSYWLHMKLVIVLAMTGFHGFCARWLRAFAEDRNAHSGRFFRFMNEVPTLMMIIVVVLVIVQPF
ncbi:MAG: protoporphyrinogen oxidase HemJ [Pseudomonadota bacterium]